MDANIDGHWSEVGCEAMLWGVVGKEESDEVHGEGIQNCVDKSDVEDSVGVEVFWLVDKDWGEKNLVSLKSTCLEI